MGRLRQYFTLLFFVFMMLNTLAAFAGPGRTTYQAKIIKPDGYPLEASSVTFKFTILDPSATCILYSENYNAVNMSSTSGLISFSLGSGVKSFPVSSTTFEQVFSNITPFLACDSGGPANYSPNANDMRRIVMQFNDGNGWQTLPAMSINAVPYAMYANDTLKFNGLQVSDFVQVSTIPSCGASEAIRYNGSSFNCVAVGSGETVTSGSVVTALGYTPADGASVTAISSSLATTNSTVSSVSSTLASVSSTVFSVSSTVSSLSNTVSTLSTSVANLSASMAAITSSQWLSSGTSISYSMGNVGIGAENPSYRLHVRNPVSGATSVGVEAYAGTPGLYFLRANGTAAAPLPVSSAQSLLEIAAVGYGQTNYINTSAAKILMMSEDNWSDATGAASIRFHTRGSSSTAASLERMRIAHNGFVGIGTTSPTTKLDVAGGIRIGIEPATCDASLAGTIRYNSGNVEYCNGTAWSSFNAGAITSSAVISALTYTPANQASMTASFTAVTATTNNLSTSITALAATDATLSSSLTTLNSSVTNLTSSMGAIVSSQWITSGTNIYYSAGKVGIGTSAPITPLDVTSDSGLLNETATLTLAQYNSVSAATNSSLIFRRARGPLATPTRINVSDIIGGIYANGYYDDGAGSAGFPSQNSGAIRFMADENFAASGTLGTRIVFDTTASGTNSRTTKMVVTGEGNIGIGTTAPEALLQIVGKPTASGATIPLGSEGSFMITTNPSGGTNPQGFLGSLWFGGKEGGNEGTYKAAGVAAYGPSDVTTTSAETDLLFYTTASGSLTANEKMRIMANGYVGVGTSSPVSLLHLSNNTAQLRVETNNPNTLGNAPIYLMNQDITANNVLDIFFATNDASLEPDNGAIIRSIFTARSATGITADLAFLTASNAESPTEKMRLTSSGTLGLGTASPTARLHFSAGSATLAPLKFTSGTLLSTAQAGAMEYDGTNFYVTDGLNQRRTIATGSSTGSIDNASTINSTGNITLTPTGSVIVSSTTASTNSSTGALVVNGGVGIAGDTNVSGAVTASNIGIGVSIPTTRLDVRSEGATKVARIQYSGSSFGTQPNLEMFRSRGTLAAPTAVLANDVLGSFSGVGHYGTAFASGSAAGIMLRAAQNYTATEQGAYIQFLTTVSGSVVQSEKMRLDPTGYLGIGITTPLAPLHVQAGNIAALGLEDDDDGIVIQNYQPTLTFKDNSAGDPNDVRLRTEGAAFYFESSPDFFVSAPTVTSLMTLSSSGELGIGTTNPGARLQVATPVSSTGSNNRMIFGNSNSDLLDVTGLTGDVYLDHAVGARYTASTSTTLTRAVTFKIDGAPNVASSPLTVSELLALWVQAGNVSFGGNLGIGVTSPTAALVVSKATTVGSQIQVSNNSVNGYITAPSSGEGIILSSSRYNGSNWVSDSASAAAITVSEGSIQMFTNGGLTPGATHSYSERFRIDSAGNIGIGTNVPNTMLHLKNTTGNLDTIYIDRADNSPNLDIYTSYNGLGDTQSGTFAYGSRPSADQWQIWERGHNAAWTNLFAVTKSGAVGIGTMTPNAKLHVKGHINSELDSPGGILGQVSVSGRNSSAATPYYTQWSIYNMKEYGPATGLSFYEYYDANNNGVLCEGGDVCASRVTFAAGGNVGIGVQAPTYLLQLSADSAAKPGTNTWTIASDMRLKDSRGSFTRGMDALLGLDTIYFTYKKDNALGLPSDKEFVGIRAQDVQKVVPEAVTTDEKGFLHFTSDAVFWTAVNAIKQLYHKIIGHDAELEKHAREIASIKEENEMLKQQNADKDKQLQDIRGYLCAKDPNAPICK